MLEFITTFDQFEDSENKWIAFDPFDLRQYGTGPTEGDAIEDLIAQQLEERTVH